MHSLKHKKKKAVLKPDELATLMLAYVQIEEGLNGAIFCNVADEDLVKQALDVYHKQLDRIADRILNTEGD